ncbi:MAG: hypothetical protein K9L68_05720 [Spirochaetales bacterium]|nr:hypothetical protein [Spirochaetales bacterium]MCF7938078.1 hypothetical protein [Spirochaetales bacterium]
MELTVAIASDDGTNLIKRHFGEAEEYQIYRLYEGHLSFQETITNTTEEESENEEHKHGDPKKAKNVGSLMKAKNVQVLVSRQFGRNIKRMVKEFVPVIVRCKTVDDAQTLVVNAKKDIEAAYEAGEKRKHLVLK